MLFHKNLIHMFFGNLFSRSSKRTAPAVPAGMRIYAIGDVHGRDDLLEQMLQKIDDDMQLERPNRVLLVFLGDLVDRGPASSQVLYRLRTYRREGVETIFLMGNHEEVLLRILAGDRGLVDGWLRFGGAELLRSYGFEPSSLKSLSGRATISSIKGAIPREDAEFVESFADTLSVGDYLFVHAGIRPDLDLSLQLQSDLRWIRQPFLECETDHGRVVVHGHTISEVVVERSNRIGIDTGAYRTGILTALVLEGSERRFIATDDCNNAPRPID